jgi:hypothetical protein
MELTTADKEYMAIYEEADMREIKGEERTDYEATVRAAYADEDLFAEREAVELTIFHVGGSWGHLTANAETGEVIECIDDPDATDATGEGYQSITRFNVDEWNRAYPTEELAGMSMDILDIGFWDDQGYQAPEEDWRADMRKGGGGMKVEATITVTERTIFVLEDGETPVDFSKRIADIYLHGAVKTCEDGSMNKADIGGTTTITIHNVMEV